MNVFRKLIGDIQVHKLSRDLEIASVDDKWHFAIPWAKSCQYLCVRKILSKYSKRFKTYEQFSHTKREQIVNKMTRDGHTGQL